MSTKLGTILADFTTALSTDIVVGGTTATLSSATDDDGVALPSGRYFFTLDGSNSSKEHISCDLVGTTLTNIKSLSRQGVETTGVVRKHRIGTSVSLTDFGHIKFINDLVSGATTLNGSAPLGYDSTPVLLSGDQLATVTYVLGVVNGGAVTFDQQIISNQTSGEALAINDVVYFKEADAKWYKADADLTATFDQLQIGICKTVAASSGITIQVAISGPVSGFTGLTAGSKYYLSNTEGLITSTAGTYSVFVGWALTTSVLLFNPVLKTLPTQKEKDALVGSSGTPSSTNAYVTQDNVNTGNIGQSQTTQNATVELGEADATTKKNKIAQSFIPTKTKIRGVSLYKSASTGSFSGTVTISIQADSSGSPSGTALITQTITNADYVALPVGSFDCIFATEYTMTAGSTYWIVIETSTSDSSNHPNLGTNSAGGYANGSVKYKNTTDSWVSIATIDLYFRTLQGVLNQISQTFTITKEFTSSGVYFKNPNVTFIDVRVVGGGGGGGGCNSVTAAGGGGAGAYAFKTIPVSAIPTSTVVTIGAGGTGGTAANGSAGGTTTFGSSITALGGSGGQGAGSNTGGAGGAISSGVLSTAGLTGSNGSGTNGGDGGASGLSLVGGSGGVGSTNAGLGGNGVYGSGGGGSGGASGNQTGGNGGSGYVLITEHYN